jgi:hypothetical protein
MSRFEPGRVPLVWNRVSAHRARDHETPPYRRFCGSDDITETRARGAPSPLTLSSSNFAEGGWLSSIRQLGGADDDCDIILPSTHR